MDVQTSSSDISITHVTLAPEEEVMVHPARIAWADEHIFFAHPPKLTPTGGWKRKKPAKNPFMMLCTRDEPGQCGLVANMPGSISPVPITPEEPICVHAEGTVCYTSGLHTELVTNRKLGNGVYGAAGLRMRKFSGDGICWVELGGEINKFRLQDGQTLRVQPGCVGMYTDGIGVDYVYYKGFRNRMYGDGLYFVSLTGPGDVWLQSFSAATTAYLSKPYIPDSYPHYGQSKDEES